MLGRANSKRIPQKAPTLPSSASPTHPAAPPTDPAPKGASRPTDVLINRLHEVKRVTKSLAAYFEAISATQSTQSKALLSIATGNTIQVPLKEAQIFLPTPPKDGEAVGIADILARVRENTRVEAEGHSVLAREVQEGVVGPLKKLRTEIKAHISSLDKEVIKLADVVAKERETSVTALTNLSKSIASFQSSPLELPSVEDPFIVRSGAEAQLREQVTRENELLVVALRWQDKAKEVEEGVWREVARCWAVWEEAHAKMLLSTQKRSAELHETVASVAPDTEWNHFASLNYLIPPTTPVRDLDHIKFPQKDHTATLPIMQGVLERKKRFVRNWKEAFFVLTPAGYLHEFRSATSPQASPYLSLHLPNSTLGPMPAPGTSKGGRMKEPKFVIEGRESEKGGIGSGVRGGLHIQKAEHARVYRGKSWEAVKEWWEGIEKFTKVTAGTHAKVLADIQGPGPTAVLNAGMAAPVVEAEDPASDEEVEDGSSDEAEAFEEAQTSARTEEKPAYEATPGVLSGAERDLKLKSGHLSGGPEKTGASDLKARASTSKHKVEVTNGAPAVSAAPISSPVPAALTAAPVAAKPTGHVQDASVKLGTVEASSPTLTDTPGGKEEKKRKSGFFSKFGKKA